MTFEPGKKFLFLGRAEKDLQKMTDNFIKEVDKIAADKEKEIMEV